MNRCKQGILAILAVVGLILLLPGLAQATQIWTVDATGPRNLNKIRTAVTNADPGDTIHVLPGIYTDASNGSPISINTSDLTITGWDAGAVAGAGVVEIDVAGLYGSASGNNTGIAVMANNVTISGFTVTFNNTSGGVGIGLFSGASDCLVTDNVISGIAYGIQQYGLDTLPASGNSIVGNTLDGNQYGIHLFGSGIDGTLVAGNTAYDNIGGIVIIRDHFAGDITNVTVQGNTLYDNTSYAMLLHDYQTGFGSFENIAITGNDMTNNNMGVYVTSGVPDAGAFSVNKNNIVSDTVKWGAYNAAVTGTLDARYNWWGDAAGPPVVDGAKVSARVDYEPWLTEPIPEPATLLLLVTGLTGIPLLRRRWKRQ